MCIISLEETPFSIQLLNFNSNFIPKGLRYDEGGNIPLSCLYGYKDELLNSSSRLINISSNIENFNDRILTNIILNSSPIFGRKEEENKGIIFVCYLVKLIFFMIRKIIFNFHFNNLT